MTDTAASPAPRTPWHLWVVGVLALLWSGFGAFDYVATVTRFEPYLSSFPQEMLDYWYGLPAWLFVIWGVGIAAAVLGVLLLLLRRKLAAPLLAVSLISPAASLVAPFLYPPPQEFGGPIAATVITLISVLLTVYAFWMARRGVLR